MNINLNLGDYISTVKNPSSEEQYTNIITSMYEPNGVSISNEMTIKG